LVFTVRRIGHLRAVITTGAVYAVIVGLASAAQVKSARTPPIPVSQSEIARLSSEHRTSVILGDDSSCHEVAARARIRVVCTPVNWPTLTAESRRRFLTTFAVTHVQLPSRAPGRVDIVPIGEGLNRVLNQP